MGMYLGSVSDLNDYEVNIVTLFGSSLGLERAAQKIILLSEKSGHVSGPSRTRVISGHFNRSLHTLYP